MPLQKLQFRPGVNREGTNYSNEGGWYECDKIRFRSGYPEKLGGWTRATPGQTYQGVARSMTNWIDLNNNNLIGLGTHLKYYINRGLGVYNDVTPIRLRRTAGTALTNPFSVETGSQIMTVTDTANGSSAGDFVTFAGATGFAGLSALALNREFEIIKTIDSNSYQVILPSAYTPTSTATGGGTVDAYYQIATGLPAYTVGNGWGAGVWQGANTAATYSTQLTYTSGPTPWALLNASSTTINVVTTAGFPASGTIIIDAEIITYAAKTSTSFTGCVRGTNGSTANYHALRPTAGTPAPIDVYDVTGYYGNTGWGDAVIGAGIGVSEQLRLWSNDNYGQDLLLAPRGSAIYYWINNTATFDRAVTLESLCASTEKPPAYTNQVLTSDVSRFVIAMGATAYGDVTNTFDPLLVRWSDQENPFVWTPAITNQAGEQRLTNGSYIMQAKRNRQEILIWTDSALFSMQYLGPPYVWGFNLMMDNISIMSPNAATVVNNVAYWMGTDKFYTYSGVVATLPCTLRQYVFDDISFDQRFQVVSGSNEAYNEVWWYYVSNTEVAAATSEGRTPTVDRYVIYNHLERIWYYGQLTRTFWYDSALQPYPMAAFIVTPANKLASAINASVTTVPLVDASAFPAFGTIQIENEYISYVGITGNDLVGCTRGANGSTAASHVVDTPVSVFNSYQGTILYHEDGSDDASGPTTLPFDAFIASSDFDIGDGHNFGYIWRIIPDINFTGSTYGYPSAYFQVQPRTFPGAPYSRSVVDPLTSTQQYTSIVRTYEVQQFTQQLYTRVRGRQMNFRVGSGGQVGVNWQLGSPRIDVKPDGRR